jgi:hypothetical protein
MSTLYLNFRDALFSPFRKNTADAVGGAALLLQQEELYGALFFRVEITARIIQI